MTSNSAAACGNDRQRNASVLAKFVGRTIDSDLVEEIADALGHMVFPRPVWIGVDLARDEVSALKEQILSSKGLGYFRDLFIGTFDPETPETILDQQWLALMRNPNGPPPVLVVMRAADHQWLQREWQAASGAPNPHVWSNTYRGLPIQIDEDYDRPKVFTESEARRRGLIGSCIGPSTTLRQGV